MSFEKYCLIFYANKNSVSTAVREKLLEQKLKEMQCNFVKVREFSFLQFVFSVYCSSCYAFIVRLEYLEENLFL
jgi:hypothetical protein